MIFQGQQMGVHSLAASRQRFLEYTYPYYGHFNSEGQARAARVVTFVVPTCTQAQL